jgi:hypothetical protein
MLIKFIHTCIILSMDLTQDDDESEKKKRKYIDMAKAITTKNKMYIYVDDI